MFGQDVPGLSAGRFRDRAPGRAWFPERLPAGVGSRRGWQIPVRVDELDELVSSFDDVTRVAGPGDRQYRPLGRRTGCGRA
jgi:hypothetical protein